MLVRRFICVPLVVTLAFLTTAASPPRRTSSQSCQECLAGASEPDQPRVVRVWMFNQTRMNDGTLANILAVANRIWMPYGVAIEHDERVEAIKVIVSGNVLRSTTSPMPNAVGDTLFTDGHASPYIHLWLGAAESLAQSAEFDGRTFAARSIVERDEILGNMLGVALAHELGHYLLDSSSHSSAGLLRETLSVDDLAFPKPAHLRLTDKQQRLICLQGNHDDGTRWAGSGSGSDQLRHERSLP